jgi:hypothetical protein
VCAAQGYADAAACFSRESGTELLGGDPGDLAERARVRAAVQGGRVEEAVERVNDLDPEVRRVQWGKAEGGGSEKGLGGSGGLGGGGG